MTMTPRRSWTVNPTVSKFTVLDADDNVVAVCRTAEHAAAIAALRDVVEALKSVSIYKINGDDLFITIRFCGVDIGRFPIDHGSALALIKFNAEQHAALAKMEGT